MCVRARAHSESLNAKISPKNRGLGSTSQTDETSPLAFCPSAPDLMKLNKRALHIQGEIVSIQSRYQSDAGSECDIPVPSPEQVGWLERLESARASSLAAAAPAGRVVRDGPRELPGPSCRFPLAVGGLGQEASPRARLDYGASV